MSTNVTDLGYRPVPETAPEVCFPNSKSLIAWERLLWPLLLVALAMFGYRGVYRGVRPHITNDFFSIYSISKAWVGREAPYSTAVIVKTFQDASGYRLGRNTLAQAASYSALPGMVPLTVPFTFLKWRAANSAFVVVSVAVLGLMLWMFARRFRPSRCRSTCSRASRRCTNQNLLVFLICCLALGPIHTGLSGSNVTPLLVGLMGISYLLMREGRWVPAGILLGVVGCSKPHIAGALVLVLLVDQEWKTLRVAVLTGVASVALFVLRLAAIGVPWWSDFLQRTQQFGVIGDVNDFSQANPARYELTNLQVIVGSITSSRGVANLVAIAIGVLLVAGWWVAVRRNGKSDLLAFAAINIILLLPSYHRFDDASVLVFLFAAAWLKEGGSWLRNIAVATAVLFVLPLPAAMVQFAMTHGFTSSLLSSSTFQLAFLTCQVWMLLLISLVLVLKLNKLARAPKVKSATEPALRELRMDCGLEQ